MLKSIDIHNFKCFDEFTLELSPLTLLTGYNGAGKSSSIQPLLLISQVLRETSSSKVLALNGPLVRLGSAGDVVPEGGGAIKLGFSDDQGASACWAFTHDRALKRGELRLEHSTFNFGDNTDTAWVPSGSTAPLLKSIRDLIFIGATRQASGEAQPFPESASLAVGDVGAEGQWAGYWYIQQADEDVPESRRHPSDPRITVRAQVNAWLSELFPSASVNAEQLAGVSLSKTTFNLGRSNEWRRPTNVGYGLSYAFPLLVALVCAKPGQLIIVDSPEAHLHPRAQSAMGGILAAFAAAGVQIIIESHSDHLLSGVRLAVRNSKLAAKDTAVHFFSDINSETPSRHRVEVANDGGIANWPEGFFDQAINDLIGLS